MPETLPVDPADAGASSDADRNARIEALLLSGLDHYFAGKYEEAINIWTRVAFLERGHGRARAYIDRARGAQAERQRESEELLHQGLAAYHAGDTAAARTLLTRAIEQGGPSDVALAFLQRLNRFDVATDRHIMPPTFETGTAAGYNPQPAKTRWIPTLVASVAIAGTIVFLALPVASWVAELPLGTPAPDAVRAEPLPIVRTSDMVLARARAQYENGRLREALTLLDRIGPADPLRAEADRLRAMVQRDALTAAGVGIDLEKGPAR
jgi:tetratricopeptide (TPR) repeat protein